MQQRETYPPSQGFVHLQRRLAPGERVPACPSLAEQLLAAAGAAAARREERPPEAPETAEDAEDCED